jgi:hypothetical protein
MHWTNGEHAADLRHAVKAEREQCAVKIERLTKLLKDAAEYLTSSYCDEGYWIDTGAMEIVKAVDALGQKADK